MEVPINSKYRCKKCKTKCLYAPGIGQYCPKCGHDYDLEKEPINSRTFSSYLLQRAIKKINYLNILSWAFVGLSGAFLILSFFSKSSLSILITSLSLLSMVAAVIVRLFMWESIKEETKLYEEQVENRFLTLKKENPHVH